MGCFFNFSSGPGKDHLVRGIFIGNNKIEVFIADNFFSQFKGRLGCKHGSFITVSLPH